MSASMSLVDRETNSKLIVWIRFFSIISHVLLDGCIWLAGLHELGRDSHLGLGLCVLHGRLLHHWLLVRRLRWPVGSFRRLSPGSTLFTLSVNAEYKAQGNDHDGDPEPSATLYTWFAQGVYLVAVLWITYVIIHTVLAVAKLVVKSVFRVIVAHFI